jgi:hypothetical protein
MPKNNPILPAAFAVGLALSPALAFAQPRDGTPGNPPSNAVGRAVDSVTGRPTIPDGQPGNPPGTAVGRAIDSATGQATSPDGTGNNPPGTAVGRAIERAGTAVDRAIAPAAAPAQPATAMRVRDITASSRASRIIGAKVYNDRGESIGEVEELVLRHDNTSPMVVISVGGFLGIGARLVAVPLSELRYAEADQRWMLAGATKESLQQRPEVTYAARG